MADETNLAPVVVPPGGGRTYAMGRMSAVFKADLDETGSTVSVSEWWLDANTEGPHLHEHPESHVFYVIEGTLTVFLGGRGWVDAARGSYVFIPGGTEHGFENRSPERVGFVAINTPGGFEAMAPHIVSYFEEHPLGDAPER